MRYILITILAFSVVSCAKKEIKWDATGTFEATEVTVSAEGTGNIVRFDVEEGRQLTSDEVVGCIDTVQLHLKKLQLKASRSAAINRLQDVAKQIAVTEQQIEWQKSEKKRFEGLLSKDASTQKQVDDISNQIAVLNKQLVAQHSTLESGNKSITDDSKSIEIQIAQIEDQLLKCNIVAPITGCVLVNFVEKGEFASVGKPLFTIADMNNIYLRAYITADLLTKMKIGEHVKVYSDFGEDDQREYDGIVEWVSSRSEFTPKTIQTRNERASLVYAVKIAVKNDGYLKIGMYGEVKL